MVRTCGEKRHEDVVAMFSIHRMLTTSDRCQLCCPLLLLHPFEHHLQHVGHWRSHDFFGGIRPTTPSHASFVHTFEAVSRAAGGSGSAVSPTSVSKVMGDRQYINVGEMCFIPMNIHIQLFNGVRQLRWHLSPFH